MTEGGRDDQIMSLCKLILASSCFTHEEKAYALAKRPDVRSQLIKTVDCCLEFTDEFECQDVMWGRILDDLTGELETEESIRDEFSAGPITDEELQEYFDERHALEDWLKDDTEVLKFIRDFRYNVNILIGALKTEGLLPKKAPKDLDYNREAHALEFLRAQTPV
jgi:hypothetical protein